MSINAIKTPVFRGSHIKVFAVTTGIPMEKTGDAKYNSGTINVAKNAKHDFKVSGISDGYSAGFCIEVIADGTTYSSTNIEPANSIIIFVYTEDGYLGAE